MSNIIFNNKNYSVDDSFLSTHSNALKQHLSTVMSGTGATIKLGGVVYNVDAAKLASAKSAFIAHLGSISGDDSGSGSDSSSSEQYIAGLYQTGAIALYNEQGAEAIEGMMIKSWDELVDSGAIVIDDCVVSSGMIVPDNLPEKNEYGFYFGVPYGGLALNEDGSANMYNGDEIEYSVPSGTFKYDVNSIDASAMGIGILQVSNNGLALTSKDGIIVSIGTLAQFDGDLIMPDDAGVVAFAPFSFENKTTLTGIKMPYGITSINDGAFNGCSSLTSVNIPDGVTSIGQAAFARCSSLTIVNISDSVTSIGFGAFASCSSLTSINIPDGVTSISDNAFYDCSSLTSINIPDNVTSIGVNTFRGCSSLTSINIPDGVTSIGDSAFCDCSSLTSINIPDGVTSIGYVVFFGCSNLTSVIYAGTIAQWNAITKGWDWNIDVPATYVQCSDGQVEL